MKIAHVLPTLIKGGGERVAVELANEAARAGHEVTIIAAHPVNHDLLQRAVRQDVTVRFVTDAPAPKTALYARMLLWTWSGRAWLFEFDVLHCHLTYGAVFGSLVQLWRRLLGKRRPVVVETYHAVGMPIPRAHRRLHARLAAGREALALMAEDPYWQAFRASHPGLMTQTIPNGVSMPAPEPVAPSARAAYRRGLGIPEDSLVVGTVGMLRPDRRPWLYIPVFARIARDFGKGVQFIVAGSGTELGRMQALVAEQGLAGTVHLAGLAVDPRVPMSVIDLYLTVNVGPATGLAAMEAAMAGLPILAVQLFAEYTAAEDDWIWSSTDPDEVAVRAVALLRSPEARRTLALRQAAHVRKHHSAEAMGRAYQQLYQAAIAAFQGDSGRGPAGGRRGTCR